MPFLSVVFFLDFPQATKEYGPVLLIIFLLLIDLSSLICLQMLDPLRRTVKEYHIEVSNKKKHISQISHGAKNTKVFHLKYVPYGAQYVMPTLKYISLQIMHNDKCVLTKISLYSSIICHIIIICVKKVASFCKTPATFVDTNYDYRGRLSMTDACFTAVSRCLFQN